MKKIAFSLISLLFSIAVLAQGLVSIPANNPLIEYTGRIDFKDPLAPAFSYSGVSVRAAFHGKSISVKLRDDGNQNFYNVIIDHAVVSRIQTVAGIQTYPISTTLADTIHEIEIYRLTEQSFGKTRFLGFMVEEGKPLIELSHKRERLIEFIGNSITCGYGNEGVNGGKFGPTTENHYLTYAGFTSRAFNARHLAVCKSGIGVYRNYGGPVEGNADCMSNLYERIFLYDAAPLYSFTQKPDLICVDLGTNDFSTNQGDSARYVSRFFQFINTLQTKNQGADILLLVGPMLWGNDLARVKRYLTFVADSATNRNQGKVYFFEMSAQSGSLGIGIDYHPTVAQHLKNSGELVGYISKLKGWDISPYPFSGQTVSGNEVTISFNTPVQDAANAFKGFSVSDELNVNIPITKTFLDASDKSKIHLVLSKSLSSKSGIKVSYAGGTVESVSKGRMQEFRLFSLSNKLTETKATKAVVDATGYKISLTFSKSVTAPASSEGLLVQNSRKVPYSVKSISLSTSTVLSVTLNERVAKSDTIYLTIESGIFGTDKVEVTPVQLLMASNLSVYTHVGQLNSLPCSIYPNPARDRIIHYSVKENSRGLKA
ncbi:MAG TPA: SGNH/GDSL hydrolase family protein, partial [Prolixibacteraceae bacterium]|nr:SGNH/GDSL hydrolase family protein [Prolixibacteraceae bacterium]